MHFRGLHYLMIYSVLIGLIANDFIQTHLFDYRDFLTVEGITGPYLADVTPDGEINLLDRVSVVKPGTTIGWVSSICLSNDVVTQGRVALVHVDDQFEVSARDYTIRPEQKRCGPEKGSITIPANAYEGAYEIKRCFTLTPKGWRHWFPITAILPSVWVTVAGPGNPGDGSASRHS